MKKSLIFLYTFIGVFVSLAGWLAAQGPISSPLGMVGPAGPICGSSGQVIVNSGGVCAGNAVTGTGSVVFSAAAALTGNVTFGGGNGTLGSGGSAIFKSGTTEGVQLDSTKEGVGTGSIGFYCFTSGNASGTADSCLSRDGANIMDLGNGTAKDVSGTLQLTNLRAAAVAVASLPTCNAGAEGTRATVNNSNAASFTAGIGAVVAGGGSVHVPVVCDGTNWRIG